VRYNVSVDDARKGNYGAITTGSSWSGHPVSNLNVYGNTIYLNATTVDSSAVQSGLRFWNGGSAIKVYNNIVYTTGGAVRLVSQERDNPVWYSTTTTTGPTATRRRCSCGTAACPSTPKAAPRPTRRSPRSGRVPGRRHTGRS
jgi:hypothetical protein